MILIYQFYSTRFVSLFHSPIQPQPRLHCVKLNGINFVWAMGIQLNWNNWMCKPQASVFCDTVSNRSIFWYEAFLFASPYSFYKFTPINSQWNRKLWSTNTIYAAHIDGWWACANHSKMYIIIDKESERERDESEEQRENESVDKKRESDWQIWLKQSFYVYGRSWSIFGFGDSKLNTAAAESFTAWSTDLCTCAEYYVHF